MFRRLLHHLQEEHYRTLKNIDTFLHWMESLKLIGAQQAKSINNYKYI
jgi:hypothetical protein